MHLINDYFIEHKTRGCIKQRRGQGVSQAYKPFTNVYGKPSIEIWARSQSLLDSLFKKFFNTDPFKSPALGLIQRKNIT